MTAETFDADTRKLVPRLGARIAVRRLRPLALLAPSLVALGLFTYWPVLSVAIDSLYARRLGARASVFVGLDNYVRLLRDDKFAAALINNLIYIAATVVPSLILALAFALLLRRSTVFNRALRALLFFPTVVPLIAAAALWTFLFLPTIGLIDYYLGSFLPVSVNWIGDERTALAAISFVTVWKNAGYYMLFYLAALQAMPHELVEAAILDGAGPWQRLRHVILPLLAPTTSFVAVIAFIQAITTVDHVIVMTRGGPSDSTTLLLYYVFTTATEVHDIGKAAAATVLTLALLLLVSGAGIRVFERRGGDAN
ncbi:MAG TPA: sugar ABC transporter permease [Stellaceae bacterium]|nr:sugar ABC transporter permease [Stellaceae bacterium]